MRGVLSFLILIGTTAVIQAQQYRLTSESEIKFTARHLGFINVEGRFAEFSGELTLTNDQVTGNGSILVKSLSTNNKKRDKELKSADFLDMEQYPEIIFSGAESYVEDDKTMLRGILTIKDKSQQITFPYELVRTGKGILVDFETIIDRTDWDLHFTSLDGVVGNEVKLYGYLLFEHQ